MAVKIGINGFGRIGRLATRAAWDNPELDIVHINEPSGGPTTAAHLLTFDSVQGRWQHEATAAEGKINIGNQTVTFSECRAPGEVP